MLERTGRVKERIRVLEVLASGAIGGGSTHVRALVTGLDPARFESVVACSDDGPLASDLERAGIRVARIPMPRTVNPWAVPELYGLIRRTRAQLVHAHGTRAALCALPAARLAGVPGLYTVHGWSCHRRGSALHEHLARSIETALCRTARHVVCVAHADHRQGVARGMLPVERSRVIPNGIEPKLLCPMPVARSRLRTELGVRQDEPLIGLFGRLTEQKAQRVFLRSARAVLDRFARARFVLVGDGEDRHALEALAKELELGERLILTGFRSDVPELLNAIDLFVLPSLWEGLPIALLEAMAVGVPAIASAVDGSVEVIEPGKSGLLVPPGEHEPLTQAIVSLLETPALAERLARAGQERVRRLYTLQSMIEATETLYTEMLPGARLALA